MLETPRLLLRPFGPGDTEHIHPIYSDPLVMRYVATGPMADIAVTQRLLEKEVMEGDELRKVLGLPKITTEPAPSPATL